MITKTLKRKEVELGFIHIPAEKRFELIGETPTPFETKLNNFPAKVDRQGRLKCSQFLKKKFPVNSEIELSKTENGFLVKLNGKHQTVETNDIMANNFSLSSSTGQELVTLDTTVLEGDCLKYLNEGKIGKVHLTFFDPPYLQGKEYRYFDDNQSETEYWNWVRAIVEGVYQTTADGGALYFMHREKNVEKLLQIMREIGWNYQNLIIWKKRPLRFLSKHVFPNNTK